MTSDVSESELRVLWSGTAQCTTPFDGLVLLCGRLSALFNSVSSRTLGARTGNFSLSRPGRNPNGRPAARNTNRSKKSCCQTEIMKGSDHSSWFATALLVSITGTIHSPRVSQDPGFGRITEMRSGEYFFDHLTR